MGELLPHSLDANLTRCTSSPASPLSFFYVEPAQAQLLQLVASLHSSSSEQVEVMGVSAAHLAIAAVLAQPPANTSWDTLSLGPIYKPNSHGRRCDLLPMAYVTDRAAMLRGLLADSAATQIVGTMFERLVADPSGLPPTRLRATTVYGRPVAGYEDNNDRPDEQTRLWRRFEQDFFGRYTRHFGTRGPGPYRESGFQGELEVLIAASGSSISDELRAVVNRYFLFFGFAVVAVTLMLWLQLSSLKLALCAVAQILGSLPLGIVVYQHLFGITKLTELTLLSGILTVGIGADDVIVYTDAWRLAHAKPRDARLRETLAVVGLSLINTSFTSAIGFLSLAFLPVPSLGCFGVLSAVMILSDLVLTLTLWPACVLLAERRCAPPVRPSAARHTRASAPEQPASSQPASSISSITPILSISSCASAPRRRVAGRVARLMARLRGSVSRACGAYARGLAWSEGHRLFKPVSLALLAASVFTVGGFAAAATNVQLEDQFFPQGFLKASHVLERFTVMSDEFGGQSTMRGVVVFGLRALDRRGVDMFKLTAERGVVQWDEEMRLEEPTTQQALLALARRLRGARCTVAACNMHPTLLKPGAPVDFFLEAWADELRTQGRGLPHGDAFEPQLRAWLATPRGAAHSNSAGMVHGKLRFVQLLFTSTTLDVGEFVRASSLNQLQARWREEFDGAAAREAIPALARGFVVFPGGIAGCDECDPHRVLSRVAQYQLIPTMLQAVQSSLAVCIVACLVLVSLTVRSLRLGIFSACSVVSILAVLLGCIPSLGWNVGLSEMGGMMLCVGFCVDYTLHLACAFHHSAAPTREARVAEAAERMGPSVLGGGLTTVCAVVFLLPGDLMTIFKLAVLLLLTIGISLAGAFGLFLPLCALFGPEQARLPSPRVRDPPRAMDATRTAEARVQVQVQ